MVSINVSKTLRSEVAALSAARQRAAADGCSRDFLGGVKDFVPLYTPGTDSVGQQHMQGLTYVGDFVLGREQAGIIDAIDAASEGRWSSSSCGRKIANFGGSPSLSSVTEALPPVLAILVDRMLACGLLKASQRPNHCLVNSYTGNAACSIHQDGPLYEPRVVTITLGGPALITFYACTTEGAAGPPVTQVMLKPGAVLMAEDEAYSDHLHGIDNHEADVVGSLCCNRTQTYVSLGQIIPRAARRLSLVFVRKRNVASSVGHQ